MDDNSNVCPADTEFALGSKIRENKSSLARLISFYLITQQRSLLTIGFHSLSCY